MKLGRQGRKWAMICEELGDRQVRSTYTVWYSQGVSKSQKKVKKAAVAVNNLNETHWVALCLIHTRTHTHTQLKGALARGMKDS